MSETKTRYDLSQGLHIAQSDTESTAELSVQQAYYKIIRVLSMDKNTYYDEEFNEIVFEMGAKRWNFSLDKECCQVKILSVTLRNLYDLLQEGLLKL